MFCEYIWKLIACEVSFKKIASLGNNWIVFMFKKIGLIVVT